MSSFGRYFLRTAVLSAFLLSFHVIAHAQNQINGQVLGPGNRPVTDVFVELYNDINRMLTRVKTDGSGMYFFRGMGTGRFVVRVRPFGTDYDEESQEVTIASINLAPRGGTTTIQPGNQPTAANSGSDSQYLVFYLRPRKDPNKAPAAITGVVFAQDIPKEAQALYEKAIADLDGNRTALGVSELEGAIKAFPDYYLANDRLGVELLKQGKWEEARQHFKKAASINPKSANCWYGIAYTSYAVGLIDDAIDAAKKATAISPDSSDMALMLGISLRRAKQYAEAEAAMLKAKKLSDGRSPDVFWNLALLYAYNLKRYQLAADELENYLKVKPDHPDAEKLKKLIQQYRMLS